MEDLARRLVDAVRPYVWACQDAQTPEDAEELSHNATAAVLRIVAVELYGRPGCANEGDLFDALADEIREAVEPPR
jgi:hypothetical protein